MCRKFEKYYSIREKSKLPIILVPTENFHVMIILLVFLINNNNQNMTRFYGILSIATHPATPITVIFSSNSPPTLRGRDIMVSWLLRHRWDRLQLKVSGLRARILNQGS